MVTQIKELPVQAILCIILFALNWDEVNYATASPCVAALALCKVVLNFESYNKILQGDHSNQRC